MENTSTSTSSAPAGAANTQTDVPVLVIETPNFMGLPTEEGAGRAATHRGERTADVSLSALYVHGYLEDKVGYDIPMFVSGHIRDVDSQPAVLIDSAGIRHECLIVSCRLPHTPVPTRIAFVVDTVDEGTASAYLSKKARDTSARSPRPFL